MYNVAQSAIVERVMQAPKAPWVAPAEGIEGYEKVWKTANTANHAYLPYNHLDDEGNIIPAPQRVAPTVVENGLQQVAMGASEDIKSETGQYDASLGQKSNETSGRAIMARQREGDNATYHYVDNLARAVRHIGRIVLDMIPRVYDTKRIAKILGEDGEANSAILDPNSPEAMQEFKDEKGEIRRIFNPTIGLYDVYTTTGPSFTTRRMEAVDAMTAMTQANPQLWQVIGDLLVKNMDWPGADDMAKRLRLTLAPPIQQELDKDEGQSQLPPQVVQAMEQMKQTLDAMAQELDARGRKIEELQSDNELKLNDQLIKAYDAETKRLQAMGGAMTPEMVQALVIQTLGQALQTPPPAAPIVEEMMEIEQGEHMPPIPPPEEMPQQEPPPGGFFTPENGAMPAEGQAPNEVPPGL